MTLLKRISLLIAYSLPCMAGAYAQSTYWQQEVNYNISVTLNDVEHSLKGTESIVYVNHSPDTLSYIWFHLWPNAYKDNTTALYQQLSHLEERKEKLQNIKDNGYISNLDFTTNTQKLVTEPHPQYADIIKVILREKLLPGQKVSIATPFFVKIPSYFSRMGHDGQIYLMSQWYPKPAVYDRKGWHEMPYLDQGEFYSEYGSFDVHITVPSAYVVAATGVLETTKELEQYKRIGQRNLKGDTATLYYRAANPKNTKTIEYYGENIHDFAWFANKNFIINYDTLQLASGKIIDVFSYYLPGGNKQWIHSVSFIKDAVIHYSKWVGEYLYPAVNAVEGPGNISSGGMEYPMITLITSPLAGKEDLDGVIAHEVGHNWFYGILGSNEREHPWMDEGINSYYEFRYEAEKYRANTVLGSMIPAEIKKLGEDEFLGAVYNTFNEIKTTMPIDTGATAFASEFDYGIVEYAKTAVWMYIMEKAIGKEDLEKGMHAYFNTWKFKHPYPEDLKDILEQTTNTKLDKLFALLKKTGSF